MVVTEVFSWHWCFQGRPKGVTPKYSLKALVPRLSELLGTQVCLLNFSILVWHYIQSFSFACLLCILIMLISLDYSLRLMMTVKRRLVKMLVFSIRVLWLDFRVFSLQYLTHWRYNLNVFGGYLYDILVVVV